MSAIFSWLLGGLEAAYSVFTSAVFRVNSAFSRLFGTNYPDYDPQSDYDPSEYSDDGENEPPEDDPTQPPYEGDDDGVRTASAFDGYTNLYTFYNPFEIEDPRQFFNYCYVPVSNRLSFHGNSRVYFQLFLIYRRVSDDELVEKVFNATRVTYIHANGAENMYARVRTRILELIDRYENGASSGFVFVGVDRLEMNTAVYRALRGGSSFIETPKFIKDRHAVVNVKNEDKYCFWWAIGRGLDPNDVEHANRASPTLRRYTEQFDWSMFDDSDYPMKYNNKEISKFEHANEVRVNIIGLSEDEKFLPLRVSIASYERIVILLLIGDNDHYHYVTVRNISRLMCGEGGKNWCMYCLLPSRTKPSLAKHIELCSTNKPCRVSFPSKGNDIKSFRNKYKGYRHPIVGYADFESFLKEVPEGEAKGGRYQKHVPCASCLYFVSPHKDEFDYEPMTHIVVRDDEDAAKAFVDKMLEEVRNISMILDNVASEDSTIGTRRRLETYVQPTDHNCYLCGKVIKPSKSPDEIVSLDDYDIFTGVFYGHGHKGCVKRRRKPFFIPIFMHNLTGYDAHLFIKQLSQTDGVVGAIPKTDEKYISFSKKVVSKWTDRDGKECESSIEVRFLDSYRFLGASLDKLVKLLKKEELVNLAKFRSDELFGLSTKKLSFPYVYVKSVSDLDSTELPGIAYNHSYLHGTRCDKQSYHNFKLTFDLLGGMRATLEHYMVNDVLQLSDVFERFRDQGLGDYGLDPVYYYTTPGLADDACMKVSDVKLELITEENNDMYLLFEEGIRGGVSTVRCKYAKANNKYLDDYDPSKRSTYIIYWDMNALYSGAMECKLPVGDFRWATEEELANWRLHPGMYVVDLKYPTELHDLHNDYPLAPESMLLGGVRKLVPNLNDKKEYVAHHEFLKKVTELGLVITKVHRGVLFREEEYAAKYIDHNIVRRQQCEEVGDNFGKDHYKMMNNAYFGKTMENKRQHSNVKITNDKEAWLKMVREIGYVRTKIFGEEGEDAKLVAVHMEKTDILLDKPMYVGQAILDISKTHMYEFHYNYVKRKWGNRAKLLMTDTDSLAYLIETDDVYEDIKDDVHTHFDTSNYCDKSNKMVEPGVNMKKLRMMKDENKGIPIVEWAGLRAKSYSFLSKCPPKGPEVDMFPGMYEDDLSEAERFRIRSVDKSNETKKSKGVQKSVIKHKFTHEDFKICALEGRTYLAETRRFASDHHRVYTEKINKVALCREDNKCIMKPNGIDSWAIGHYATKV